MLSINQAFPNFQLKNQDGQTRTLKDYAGKWLVLYFYPKDDTPGCTIQGKSFTSNKEEFDKHGVTVVGVSKDDVASHKNFCNKFSFTIELLSDPQAELMKAAGLSQGNWMGVPFWERTTFLIDPKGIIRKTYEKVKPEGHEAVLLKDIKELHMTTGTCSY